MGEGSANPTDPHRTPTIIQPSAQPQKKQKPRKPIRKDTRIPQSSSPTEHVADEAIYKELDDNLVRVATSASSLETEQDRGNIIKTRSKATTNKAGSQGTTLGGDPRCQETIRDTIAQTRFENVSKLSNDPLLVRGNTLRSGKDSMNLIKKLEKKGGLRNHKLKRLYKVGRSARVISSDEASLGDQEDASKHGRKIDDIDKDAEITLVDETQGRYGDDLMFDTGILDDEEVFAGQDIAGQDVTTMT
ncbi:hypothetical protein Tco_1164990 [Tanacetum coccineum]